VHWCIVQARNVTLPDDGARPTRMTRFQPLVQDPTAKRDTVQKRNLDKMSPMLLEVHDLASFTSCLRLSELAVWPLSKQHRRGN
jgi:hypothetical protein